MSSIIHQKVADDSCHIPVDAPDVKPSGQSNWLDKGNTDGGRTKNRKMYRKDISPAQAVRDIASEEKAVGKALFKSKAGSNIIEREKQLLGVKGEDTTEEGTITNLIDTLATFHAKNLSSEDLQARKEATMKLWAPSQTSGLLSTHDATTKNGAPASLEPYNTAIATPEHITAMAANVQARHNLAGEAAFWAAPQNLAGEAEFWPAPQNLDGEAGFCLGNRETSQLDASGYNMLGSSACMMEDKETIPMFQAVLKEYNMAAQEMTSASNGSPSSNGSSRSSTTIANASPVHQAHAATNFPGMAMSGDDLHHLEAGDCIEDLIPMWSLDCSNMILGGGADDELNPQDFHHLLDIVPHKLQPAFQDSTFSTPASSDFIQEVVYTGLMQVNRSDNVAPLLIVSDHASACSEDNGSNVNDLPRILNLATGSDFGTAPAADGDHSPNFQFHIWHNQHDEEEDAAIELLMTQISYFLPLQHQVHAPQMGQGQTHPPPCLRPAGDGSDSAPLFDTSAQGAMKKICYRDSKSYEISDTHWKVMDTRGMFLHDGISLVVRVSSMVAEVDLLVPTDSPVRGMKRSLSSIMTEVPTLAGHAGFRSESMTESQIHYLVRESHKSTEDRECYDHAANAQQQVPVNVKTKDRNITKADFEEMYHLPLAEAGQRLNYGSTAMKDLCRRFNIDRWPYRKLSSLDSLLRDVEAGIVDDPGRGHMIKNTIIKLKAKIREDPNTPIDPEVKNLRQTNFKNKYKQKQGSCKTRK